MNSSSLLNVLTAKCADTELPPSSPASHTEEMICKALAEQALGERASDGDESLDTDDEWDQFTRHEIPRLERIAAVDACPVCCAILPVLVSAHQANNMREAAIAGFQLAHVHCQVALESLEPDEAAVLMITGALAGHGIRSMHDARDAASQMHGQLDRVCEPHTFAELLVAHEARVANQRGTGR